MHEDLACRFQISLSSVSRIFHKWIDIMHKHLKFLIVWPSQETAQCKKLDIRYGIFLVIFENTPKYTPEYYIEI